MSEASVTKRRGKRDMTGLVLSGGGARGAYQAGVLKAVSQICETVGCAHPFDVVTGVSAGAINSAHWAASSGSGRHGAASALVELWENVTSADVFRLDLPSLGRTGIEWSASVLLGAILRHGPERSLLDTAPLRSLLDRFVDFATLRENLKSGELRGVAVSATDYATSDNITFVDSASEFTSWDRGRRRSESARLTVEHLLASSSIPLFFPPERVGDRYFGDGCLRNSAPLSPAIHLGARRLLVVGVRSEVRTLPDKVVCPSAARILSVLMNAVLLDGVDTDVEALKQKNEIVAATAACKDVTLPLRHCEYVWIRPSQDIANIALQEERHMPRILRYLIRGLGSRVEAAELISYLLFEPAFCRRLIELGYRDAMASRTAIARLLLTQPPEESTDLGL